MGFKPVVREVEKGYMLGAILEGETHSRWYFTMDTEDIAKLWQFGVRVIPADKNQADKWSGQLIFDTYNEAFLIWERLFVPKLLAEELAKAGTGAA